MTEAKIDRAAREFYVISWFGFHFAERVSLPFQPAIALVPRGLFCQHQRVFYVAQGEINEEANVAGNLVSNRDRLDRESSGRGDCTGGESRHGWNCENPGIAGG